MEINKEWWTNTSLGSTAFCPGWRQLVTPGGLLLKVVYYNYFFNIQTYNSWKLCKKSKSNSVTVTPNLNFTEADLNGQTLLQIVQSKGLGAPISEESIHEWMQDQGFTKLTYEEELKRLEEEEPAPGSNLVSPVDQPPGQQQPGQQQGQ